MVKLFRCMRNRIIVATHQSLAGRANEGRSSRDRVFLPHLSCPGKGRVSVANAGEGMPKPLPVTTAARSYAAARKMREPRYARSYDFSGAKNRIVRASILSRGAALSGEVGSSKPEWAVNRVRFSSESKHLSSNASSVRIRGK